jgi:hypothetical protein
LASVADDAKIKDSGSGGLVKQLGIRVGEPLQRNMPRVEGAAATLIAGGASGVSLQG